MKFFIFFIILIFFISSKILAATNYVSLTGKHVPPFANWTDAATNIQAAVDVGLAGDTVLVNDGTYYPASQIFVTNSITVKSVNGAEKTVVDGSFPDQTNRCFYLANNPTLDGFTITNCYIYYNDWPHDTGAGVYCYKNGKILNCRITKNKAWLGGGVFFYYGGEIINSTIINNESGYGGGIECYVGGIVSNCSVLMNNAEKNGGGVECTISGLVQNCTIKNNFSDDSGGGVNCYNGGTIVDSDIISNEGYGGGGVFCSGQGLIDNCYIKNNHATDYDDGAGVYCSQGGTVRNSIIENNSGWLGSGIYCYGGTAEFCFVINHISVGGSAVDANNSSLVFGCIISNNNTTGISCENSFVNNSVIVQNSSQYDAGIYCTDSEINNCLVIENSADFYGGGIHCDGSIINNCTIFNNTAGNYAGGVLLYGTIKNSIIWGNLNDNIYGDFAVNSYNCIENWTNLVDGIITNNPNFIDATSGNYRLKQNSFCRDSGTNSNRMWKTTDLDGNPRILNNQIDIGCYEYVVFSCFPLVENSIGINSLTARFSSVVFGTNTADLFYSWDFDTNGFIDIQGTNKNFVTHHYTNSGKIFVKLSVSNEVGEFASSISDFNLTIIPPVISEFYADAITNLIGENIQFYDLSTNVPQFWFWDFDDDGSFDSFLQNPLFTFNETGTFNVILTVSNNFGYENFSVDSITKTNYITILPEPTLFYIFNFIFLIYSYRIRLIKIS